MNAKVVGHTSAGAFHEMMASHLQCRHASFLGNAFVPLLLKTNKIDSLNKPKILDVVWIDLKWIWTRYSLIPWNIY
jgi:hypothetical protein